MTQRIIVSGFGGQGVLSQGLMIASSAVQEHLNATFFPSYGAEMRGGTANCHVIVSDSAIGSPLIDTADALIAFNEPSVTKFLSRVKKGGEIFINSSVVKKELDFGEHEVIKIPADEIAFKELGSNRAANIIMLGAVLKRMPLVSLETVMQSIKEKFIKKGQKVVDLNFKALQLGYNYAA